MKYSKTKYYHNKNLSEPELEGYSKNEEMTIRQKIEMARSARFNDENNHTEAKVIDISNRSINQQIFSYQN